MKDFKITTYALSRSLLALGTLITFLGSGRNVLFDKHYFVAPNPFLKWNFFYIFGYDNINLAIVVASIILFFVILGFYPRVTGILQWWITISFLHIATLSEGGDQIAVILTFLLIPITLYDSRINHWIGNLKHSENKVVRIALFLISIQMSVLYFNASIGKMGEPEWADGTAFYYWATNNAFSENGILSSLLETILINKWIVVTFTWGAILTEIILAVAIFVKDQNKRTYILIFGLLFHFTIIIIFGLVSFFLAMAAGILLYLVPINQDLKLVWKQIFYLRKYNNQTTGNS